MMLLSMVSLSLIPLALRIFLLILWKMQFLMIHGILLMAVDCKLAQLAQGYIYIEVKNKLCANICHQS